LFVSTASIAPDAGGGRIAAGGRSSADERRIGA